MLYLIRYQWDFNRSASSSAEDIYETNLGHPTRNRVKAFLGKLDSELFAKYVAIPRNTNKSMLTECYSSQHKTNPETQNVEGWIQVRSQPCTGYVYKTHEVIMSRSKKRRPP